MYHEASLDSLSKKQVSRLLNGHPVRVKHGPNHMVHLSTEQCKKLQRAHLKGAGITLTLDPYQIEALQHLRKAVGLLGRGTGTKLGARLGHITGDVADACGERAIRGLEGSGTGTKLGARLGRITGDVADACGERAIRGLEGSGRPHYLPTRAELKILKKTGGKLSNKLKHAQEVMDFLGHNYQGIAHAVRPVSKPILGALTTRAVNYINPMHGVQDFGNSVKSFFGGAVGKRAMSPAQKAALAKGRAALKKKREHGGSFILPGY